MLILESGVLGEMRNWAAAKDLIVSRTVFPWTILERPFCKEPFTPEKIKKELFIMLILSDSFFQRSF